MTGVFALTIAGCDDSPTGLLAVVDSNLGARLSSVTLTVNDGVSEQRVTYSLVDGHHSLPGSISVVPTSDSIDRTVRIEAIAVLADGTPSFSQVARVNFQLHHVLQVDMFLAAECAVEAVRLRCESTGQTCGAGGLCIPIVRSSLPDVPPGPVMVHLDAGAPSTDLGPDANPAVDASPAIDVLDASPMVDVNPTFDAPDASPALDVPALDVIDAATTLYASDGSTDRVVLDVPRADAVDASDVLADVNLRCDDAGCFSPVVSVAAGASNTCVCLEDGRVFCLGANVAGVLGNASDDGGIGGMTEVRGIPPMVEVTVDGNFGCARTAPGAVWCWGENRSSQLGLGFAGSDAGSTVFPPTPMAVVTDARRVLSGSGYSCVIRADSTLWCWGTNGADQLGLANSTTPITTPTRVPGITGVTAASVGGHTCAVAAAGAVYCWGPNTVGQVTGVSTLNNIASPALVAGVPAARSIAVGRGFTCAMLVTGEVSCWGENTGGRLGRTTVGAILSPGLVPGLSGVREISGGSDGVCAILDDGRVSCWGLQRDGELGTGATTTTIGTPTILTGLANTAALTSAIFSAAPVLSTHRCALTGAPGTRHRVFCWGLNTFGQLGEGTTNQALRPIGATLFP